MCGKVTIDRIPESLGAVTSQRRIIYSPEGKGSEAISKVTDAEGKFCVKVKPGRYIFNVSICLFIYLSVSSLGVNIQTWCNIMFADLPTIPHFAEFLPPKP